MHADRPAPRPALPLVFVCALSLCALLAAGCSDAPSDPEDSADAPLADAQTSDTASDVAPDSDATERDAGDVDSGPAPLLETYTLDDDQAYPEAVTFDPEQRAFFTSSMGRGDVTRVAADGSQSQLFAGEPQGEWLTLGLEADPARRRLWVCAAQGRDLSQSAVWVLDLDTGERLWSVSLEDVAPGAVCIDLIIDDAGVAYACDRAAGNIFRLDFAARDAQLFASDPLLAPDVIGQNGIAFTPGGAHLLTVKLLPIQLMRISLSDPTDVAEVALVFEGDVFPSGGADALVVVDGVAYIATDKHALRATPDADWTTATVTTRALRHEDGRALGGVSGLTVAEGALYASKSDVINFALGLRPELPFLLRRLDRSMFDVP